MEEVTIKNHNIGFSGTSISHNNYFPFFFKRAIIKMAHTLTLNTSIKSLEGNINA